MSYVSCPRIAVFILKYAAVHACATVFRMYDVNSVHPQKHAARLGYMVRTRFVLIYSQMGL